MIGGGTADGAAHVALATTLVAYLAACRWALAPLQPGRRCLLLGLCALKGLVATTMGHLDIVRFLAFIQQYLHAPDLNPWTYAAGRLGEADFPYPPPLLYLHAAALTLGRAYLPLTPPFPATPLGFVLIRLPLLLSDVAVLAALLRGGAGAAAGAGPGPRRLAALHVYLFSPVVLFHQFYSGQLDLVAAAPLALAWQAAGRGARLRRHAYLALSVLLKPFAVLFFPGFVLAREGLRARAGCAAALAAILLLGRVAQWPWSAAPAYRDQVGAGAVVLLGAGPLVPWPAFVPFFAGSLVLLAWRLPQLPAALRQPAVVRWITLGVAGLCEHSAGWMTWVTVAMCATALQRPLGRAERRLLAAWGVAFVARWTLVPHSPVLFSAAVAVRGYWNAHVAPQMGAVPRLLASAAGPDVALGAERAAAVAFALLSIALALAGLRTDLAVLAVETGVAQPHAPARRRPVSKRRACG